MIIFAAVFLIIFYLTSLIVYKQLEKMNIIPIKYHPYTEKKTKEYFAEFIRVYFFIVSTVVFLVGGYFSIFFGLLIITVIYCAFTIINFKRDKSLNNLKQDVIFDETDKEEFKKYLTTLKEKDIKRVQLPEKLVLFDDYLYFSKRKKILIKEKMYKYIFLTSFTKKEHVIIFRYGFLGIPLLSKTIFIPKRKEKLLLNVLREIEKQRRKKTFTQNYFNVFKRSSK